MKKREWPFLTQNPESQSLEPTEAAPLTAQQVKTTLARLLHLLAEPEVLLSFFALRSREMMESQVKASWDAKGAVPKITPWQVEIGMRHFSSAEAWGLLNQLSCSAVWQVSLARMRPMRRSPLAVRVGHLLGAMY